MLDPLPKIPGNVADYDIVFLMRSSTLATTRLTVDRSQPSRSWSKSSPSTSRKSRTRRDRMLEDKRDSGQDGTASYVAVRLPHQGPLRHVARKSQSRARRVLPLVSVSRRHVVKSLHSLGISETI